MHAAVFFLCASRAFCVLRCDFPTGKNKSSAPEIWPFGSPKSFLQTVKFVNSLALGAVTLGLGNSKIWPKAGTFHCPKCRPNFPSLSPKNPFFHIVLVQTWGKTGTLHSQLFACRASFPPRGLPVHFRGLSLSQVGKSAKTGPGITIAIVKSNFFLGPKIHF